MLVSLTIVPYMASRLLTDKAMLVKSSTGKRFLLRQFYRFGEWLDGLGEKYKGWLHWALNHRRLVVVGTFGLIVLSLSMVPFIGAEFIPTTDSGEIAVTLEADKGSKIEDVDKIVALAEAKLMQHPAVDIIYTSVGSAEMAMTCAAANKATISVKLYPLINAPG